MNENDSRLDFGRGFVAKKCPSGRCAMLFEGSLESMNLRPAKKHAAAGRLGAGSVVSTLHKPAAVVGGSPMSLVDLPLGRRAEVREILSPELAEERDLVLRLIEIGFVPGEQVRVVAQGFPGHEPIAVRLGGTTFALRRFEADFIRVVPLLEEPAR
jgi:ferrous iron transport protein A